MTDIIVQGLTQNNLKHVSFRIPKEKITVFTGVSGSGKSSIVFDTIAAESQRQMECHLSGVCALKTAKVSKAGGGTDRQLDSVSGGGPISSGRKRPLDSGDYKRTVLQPADSVFKNRKTLCGNGLLFFF